MAWSTFTNNGIDAGRALASQACAEEMAQARRDIESGAQAKRERAAQLQRILALAELPPRASAQRPVVAGPSGQAPPAPAAPCGPRERQAAAAEHSRATQISED